MSSVSVIFKVVQVLGTWNSELNYLINGISEKRCFGQLFSLDISFQSIRPCFQA